MANKTVELQTKIREIAQTESLHITSDDAIRFASGQLIWKLLIQSESAKPITRTSRTIPAKNRTHFV